MNINGPTPCCALCGWLKKFKAGCLIIDPHAIIATRNWVKDYVDPIPEKLEERIDALALATSFGRPIYCRKALFRRILPLVAERLKEVMLENLPWERFIKLYDSPETFFFINPPYLGHNEYRHNFKFDDFQMLAENLKQLKGRFLLIHTDRPEIRDLFKGHKIEEVTVEYSTQKMANGKKNSPAVSC